MNDVAFQTEMGFKPIVEFYLPAQGPFDLPGKSDHIQVGRNAAALNMMINNAKLYRVPVR